MSAREGSVAGLDKGRVEALTDGISATVMTVFGLSLSVPYVAAPLMSAGTAPDLRSLLPRIRIKEVGVDSLSGHILFSHDCLPAATLS